MWYGAAHATFSHNVRMRLTSHASARRSCSRGFQSNTITHTQSKSRVNRTYQALLTCRKKSHPSTNAHTSLHECDIATSMTAVVEARLFLVLRWDKRYINVNVPRSTLFSFSLSFFSSPPRLLFTPSASAINSLQPRSFQLSTGCPTTQF